MSSEQDRARRRRWAAAAALAASACGAWWAVGGGSGEPRGQRQPASRAPSPAVASVVQQAASPAVPPPPDARYPARPDFLSDGEWAALRNAVRDDPDGQTQLARMVSYLGFERRLQRWQAIPAHESGLRERLARELLDALPALVASGVMPAIQAQRIQAEIVLQQEDDPVRRQQRMQAERLRLPSFAASDTAFPY